MTHAVKTLYDLICGQDADSGFERLYGIDSVAKQKKRYLDLLDQASTYVSTGPPTFISAPGRTELGGNHTDHNNGRILAAAVDLDCVAVVSPSRTNKVQLISKGFKKEIVVDLQTRVPQFHENGTPEALVRGVAAALYNKKATIGGFTGIIHSTCEPGTGLSSSAAFSVLIGAAFTQLYSPDNSLIELAYCARYAENIFFGKPCGLMDQMSSAIGEIVSIDFEVPDAPDITTISDIMADSDYQLVIINTGGSHAELTSEYAAIPCEISDAVKLFGKQVARGLSMDDVLEKIGAIRSEAGDRALLRLMHFINEDLRAEQQARALQDSQFGRYLELVRKSGESSCRLLQNCSVSTDSRHQGVMLGLVLTEQFFPEAVCRVHGGGFAGTIQTYIPDKKHREYQDFMNRIFGDNSVIPIKTGRPGVSILDQSGWFFPGDRR